MVITNFSDPETLSYIKTVGYPVMFLIMVIEGPIVALAASFLAKLGFFNIFIVFFLSLLGDIVGDIILYSLGYLGGAKILRKAERFLHINPQFVQKIEKHFKLHGQKTIIAVKSTTGLCWITFIAAGTVRMDFKKFLTGSFLGGIVWSSFLIIVGYFFGYAFGKINDYIQYAGITIFISFVVFYLSVSLYKKYQAKKLLVDGQ